ncbi:putative ribonuclease H-like domain-containing protein, partial [Tanacetum coccineum]
MPIWKDASYFDSPSKDIGNVETKSATDDQKQVEDGPNNGSDEDDTSDNEIGDVKSSVQTRRMIKPTSEQGLNLQILVDLPTGKRAIGTKWVFKNKKDKRGIVIRNKSRLVEQGHRKQEGIDYEEVFAPMARIKAIRLFLAYASFMGFL